MVRQGQAMGASSQNSNINDVYWQKPDGWIITGPSAEIGADGRMLTRQAESLVRRGWKPLVEYSYTGRINGRTGRRETIELNADKLNTHDRYWWLFKNGGAHVFTIEQIVHMHWHITPPFGLPKSVFPQLDEWDVPEPRWCPQCVGRAPMNSDDQVIKHLILVHKPMTGTQAAELVKFAKEPPAGAGGIAIRRKVKEAEVASIAEIAIAEAENKPTLHVCNNCGEAITGRLADHQCSPEPQAQTPDGALP